LRDIQFSRGRGKAAAIHYFEKIFDLSEFHGVFFLFHSGIDCIKEIELLLKGATGILETSTKENVGLNYKRSKRRRSK
jgi:hypothetical protein